MVHANSREKANVLAKIKFYISAKTQNVKNYKKNFFRSDQMPAGI